MSKPNQIFLALALLFISGLSFLWYRFHPSSPYVSRNTYQFYFSEIGTLEQGNLVKVNGIDAGRVLSVEILGDGVLVKATVLKNAAISHDSEIKVMNLGLVGERMIHILQGESDQVYTTLDTIGGKYDPGSTKLVVSAATAFQNLKALSLTLKQVADSTFNHPMHKGRLQRLQSHLHSLQKQSKNISSYTKENIVSTLDNIKSGVQVIRSHQKRWSSSGQDVANKSQQLFDNLDTLQNSLQSMSSQIAQNYKEGGSLAQLLTPSFKQEFNNTWNQYLTLHSTIITREMQVNVDFF